MGGELLIIVEELGKYDGGSVAPRVMGGGLAEYVGWGERVVWNFFQGCPCFGP